MIRATLLAAACLGLAACSTTGGTLAAPEYLDQAPPRATFESPLAAAQSLVGNYPEVMEGGPTLSVTFEPLATDTSRLELIAIAEPLMDDSVRAQEWRAVLSQGNDLRWRIAELGLRQKCARGTAPGEWQAALCL